MKYELMHRETQVAVLSVDDNDGQIRDVINVSDPAYMPVGTMVKNKFLDPGRLKTWWIDRSIPASRSGIREILERLGVSSPMSLLTESMGLSLSDQYWIRPMGADIEWIEINFFDNTFSEDLGELMIGGDIHKEELNFSSPDITSNGNLRKRWKIIDGKRVLLKGGTRPICQEPVNESISSLIAKSLNIPCVNYSIAWIDGYPYSVCEDFIDKDSDFVSAHWILMTSKEKNNSLYNQYVGCCKDRGIDIVPFLDRMITMDYLVANGDRHTNNFGLVREAESLEWIGPAPIFDSGSSLGFDLPPEDMMLESCFECKPFDHDPEKQLGMVKDFSWIDFDALNSAIEQAYGILEESRLIDQKRREAVISLLRKRADRVERLHDKG